MEELTYLKVQAQYKLAQQSIVTKQLDRYTATLDFYKELVDNYPQSTYLKDAQRYYADSLNEINKLKTKKS